MRWTARCLVFGLMLATLVACSGEARWTPPDVAHPDLVAPDVSRLDLVVPDSLIPDSARADMTAVDVERDVSALAQDVSRDAEGVADLRASTCGDGLVDPGEACDDGNTEDGDWCAADCSALVDVSVYERFEGHPSFGVLTSSNGLTAVTYVVTDLEDRPQNKLSTFRDHIYSAYDAGLPSKDDLYDLYFGFRADGVSDAETWLNRVAPEEADYVAGTGVIRTLQRTRGLAFESFYFAPFHAGGGGRRALVALTRVTNEGDVAVDDASLFALINVHIGGGDDALGETVRLRDGGAYVVEERGRVRFLYAPLTTLPVSWSADSPSGDANPWRLVTDGAHFENRVESATEDDIAVGLESQLSAGLEPGASRWAGVVVDLAMDTTEAEQWTALSAFVDGRDPEAILEAELAWWEAWHAVELLPDGLSSDEARVYRQSTAVLKMGQVRETAATGCPSDKCYGQLLASLVPGRWNISWVRDACYAVLGLVSAGHLSEARDALLFMLRADLLRDDQGNIYQRRYIESDERSAPNWGLGVDLSADYAISVTRYYGRGLEESDTNAHGPNIEWDNWGLFLWALDVYVEAAEDDALLAAWWPTVSTRVADLLIELVERETGLLAPDSSIWERHWCPYGQCDEPETRKHHAYSSIVAAEGLRRAARLARRLDDDAHATRYAAAAEALAAAVRERLVTTPARTGQPTLAGNLEEIPFDVGYMDQAAVEAMNTSVVSPGSVEAFGTIAAFDAFLGVGPHSPGYRRNDDPTWYDGQEWVVIDLRTVSALARMGQRQRARTILDWVTSEARHNHDLIGELLSDGIYQPGSDDDHWRAGYDPGGDYQGAVPMCGFGPGAYILALYDLYR